MASDGPSVELPRRFPSVPHDRPEAVLKNNGWAALRRSFYFLTGMAIFETVIVSPVISPVNFTV